VKNVAAVSLIGIARGCRRAAIFDEGSRRHRRVTKQARHEAWRLEMRGRHGRGLTLAAGASRRFRAIVFASQGCGVAFGTNLMRGGGRRMEHEAQMATASVSMQLLRGRSRMTASQEGSACLFEAQVSTR